MITKFYKGHLVRKRFGQNFLKDKFIINNIITIINPHKSQAIIEIGPGLAALTKPISEYLDKIIAIELDHNLVMYLQKQSSLKSKLVIYQQDATTMNFNELSRTLNKPLRIFGSLPYNISIPMIFHLFKYINVIVDMYFILQKEVVDRLVAKPNSKYYGRLSIMSQYFCQITSELEIPPEAFIPIPKVRSAMVHLVPHSVMPLSVKRPYLLNRIVEEAFNQRRKTIRNSLNKLFTIKDLMVLGIDSTMRAENISIAQYCQMANYISDVMFLEKN